MTMISASLEETTKAGMRLGSLLAAGDVVGLTGPLGVGKTALVGGITKGMGIEGYAITSPTFVYAHIYKGLVPLHHIDLYRIEKESQLAQLGLEEMLGGEGVAVVEWFERFPSLWTGDRLEIEMAFQSENKRIIHCKAFGPRPMDLTRKWIPTNEN